MTILFPSKYEAAVFRKRLSRDSKPITKREHDVFLQEFSVRATRVRILVTGMGKNVLRASSILARSADDIVILAGLARALNKKFNIGDLVGIESVRTENEEGIHTVLNKPFFGIPYGSLVTCARVVSWCSRDADLADMEGYYAVREIPGIAVLKAVSDRDEDVEFLNEVYIDGRVQKRYWFRLFHGKRMFILLRLLKNAHTARTKLADFLMDFLAKEPASQGRIDLSQHS